MLGALLAVILALGITGTTLFVTKIKPPIDSANEFLAAVDDGRFESAFAQLCSADRRDTSPADLEAFLAVFYGRELVSGYQVNPFDVDIDGDSATVGFDADSLDDDEKFELPLRKESGEWRPCFADALDDLG
ncbi:MAG TPA: hypothetical protein VF152_11390 [Acidimicrobiia bacterium]